VTRVAVLIISASVWAAAPAAAQVAPPRTTPSLGSIEVSGGVLWQGGFDLGNRTAELTRNDPTGGPLDLFTTSSDVDAIAGLRARVAYYLSPSVAIEGGLQYSRPVLAVRLSGDFEEAPDVTAEETLQRYLFDGSLVYYLTGLSFAAGRGTPFVSAGAGYLRELHESRELVETGTEFHGSGGLNYWLGGGRRRLGLRAEAGFSSRDGGADPGEGRRTVPVVSASVVYLF
jgi:hypothetical protein